MNNGLEDSRRITWRFARLTDAELLFQWRNERNTFQFTKQGRQLEWVEHYDWISRQIAKSKSDSVLMIFSDEHYEIGMSRLDRLNSSDFEISISVGDLYQGKGFGKEILVLSIEYAMDTLHARRVIAKIHRDNTKSQILFKNMGFKPMRKILITETLITFWLGK
jgi:RimJ/RimL family protein N-acetyltransferase